MLLQRKGRFIYMAPNPRPLAELENDLAATLTVGDEVIMRSNAYDDLLAACKACDEYFMALVGVWAKNDGRIIKHDGSGAVVLADDEIDRLCGRAARLLKGAIAKAEVSQVAGSTT